MIEILEMVILGIDAVGITILIIGAIKFLAKYVVFEFQRLQGLECVHAIKDIRIEIGSYILLALEFMIISDVIHGSITHNLEDLYALGLLVVIRTAISYFLGQELKELKVEEPD